MDAVALTAIAVDVAAPAAGGAGAVGVVTSALAPKRSRMLRSVRIAPSSAAGIEGSDGMRS